MKSMIRSLFVLFLSLTLVLGLSACGWDEGEMDGEVGETPTEVEVEGDVENANTGVPVCDMYVKFLKCMIENTEGEGKETVENAVDKNLLQLSGVSDDTKETICSQAVETIKSNPGGQALCQLEE